MLKLTLLALVASVALALNINDCDDDQSTTKHMILGNGSDMSFKNVAVSFLDANGNPSDGACFPGSIKITSGEVDFKASTHDFTGCKVDLALQEGSIAFCKTLDTFGLGALCKMDFCPLLQKAENEDVCSIISTGTSFQISSFPVTTISFAKIDNIILRLIVNGRKFGLGATISCPGVATEGCLHTASDVVVHAT